MLAILLFLRWLRSGHFHRFAYYCWAVGGAYIVYGLITA
jgi:undecaprenyl pyrophosphate phosphatase UppP